MAKYYNAAGVEVLVGLFSRNQEKSFTKFIGDRGVRKAFKVHWKEYKAMLPAKKKTASKPKKEESGKEK